MVLILATFPQVSKLANVRLCADRRRAERYCADLKEEVEFMVEKLPEGEQGMSGYDDGEGDD